MIRKCGISSSPTRSRTPLPHQHGRKRMTLGMHLVSPIECDRKPLPRQSLLRRGITNSEALISRNTLKDLMASSNVLAKTMADDNQVFVFQEQSTGGDILPRLMSNGGHAGTGRRIRRGISRPATASAGHRIRFLNRVWRPVLGAIPEGKSYDAPPHLSQ